MNFLIFEAYTDANVGSCALVENAIAAVKSRFPNAHIKVMAHRPSYFHSLYGVDAIADIFKYPFLQTRSKQILWLGKTICWMSYCWLLAPLLRTTNRAVSSLPLRTKLEAFLWADIAISVGAERINDKYFKNIAFSLYTYSLIQRLHRKLVLFPSTIGPLIFKPSRIATKAVLKRIDLIFTRDELSATIVENLIGRNSGNLIRSIDLAILQSFSRAKGAQKILPFRAKKAIVGISVMHWSYFKNKVETPFSNYKAYTKQFALLADALIDCYKVHIVFYPTNYHTHGCREDDVTAARDVLGQMKNKLRTTIVETLPTPFQLKSMLACSEVNITTRMHACILSTSSGTPTISVNYLFKIREYMESLGLERFSIDIEEFNSEWALAAFEEMWREKEKWRSNLALVMQSKEKLLSSSLDHLHDLV
ncbi:MAG: polysaccharide pyruvyl transferase family protein [Candidatus Sabulitectum sp.]|nr:polysaccharide pyruvyl transferase family protein [Candidatus Sabulitectum sp.]